MVLMWPSLSMYGGRPLTVDDAGTVAPREFEFEAGLAFAHSRDCHHFDFPFALTAGIATTLDAGVGFGSQVEERLESAGGRDTESGIGDLTLGAKWNPLAAERFWADHALAVMVKLPTASRVKQFGSGQTDCDLTYIATKSFGGRWNVDLNVGYTWVGDPDDENLDDSLHYGLALRWQARERVELVGELFADTPVTAENETTLAINAGVRWQVVDGLLLDAAAGGGLRRDAPDVTAAVGLTWAFGFNHNE
jgi:hypothetical protein